MNKRVKTIPCAKLEVHPGGDRVQLPFLWLALRANFCHQVWLCGVISVHRRQKCRILRFLQQGGQRGLRICVSLPKIHATNLIMRHTIPTEDYSTMYHTIFLKTVKTSKAKEPSQSSRDRQQRNSWKIFWMGSWKRQTGQQLKTKEKQ